MSGRIGETARQPDVVTNSGPTAGPLPSTTAPPEESGSAEGGVPTTDQGAVTARSRHHGETVNVSFPDRPAATDANEIETEFARGLSVQGPTRPQFMFDLHGAYQGSIGVPDLIDQIHGLTAPRDPQADALTSLPPFDIPAEALEAQATARVTVGVDSRYVGGSLSATLGAHLATPGSPQASELKKAFDTIAPEISGLESEYESVQGLMNDQETLDAIDSISQIASRLADGTFTAKDLAKLSKAITKIQSVNDQLQPTVTTLSQRLDTLDRALATITDGSMSLSATGNVEGMVSAQVWGRIPIGHIGSAVRDIQALVGVGVHVPVKTPESVSLDGNLPQLLAQANGAVKLSLAGTEQIKETLKVARDLVSAYHAAQPYITDPLKAQQDSAGATAAITNLTTSASTLQSTFTSSIESLSVNFSGSADVIQATGPQTTFTAGIGATIGGSDAPGRWHGIGLQFMAENFAGFGPATVNHYLFSGDLAQGQGPQLDYSGSHVSWGQTSSLIPPNLRLTATTRLPDPKSPTGFILEANAQPTRNTSGIMVGVSQPIGQHFGLRTGYEHLFTGGFMTPGTQDSDMILGGFNVGDRRKGVSWDVSGGVDPSQADADFKVGSNLRVAF